MANFGRPGQVSLPSMVAGRMDIIYAQPVQGMKMAEYKKALVRAVWNGPFYIGPLSRPVSVGDVLLKTLETLWRAVLSIVVLLVVGGLGIAAWVQFVEPTFFPPLKTQIIATATYDDGSAKLPPAIGDKPIRCSPDYPIKVAIKNNSETTIGHLDFSIEGRPANRSDNVIEGGAWRQADTIIPAGYTWQSCWAVSVEQGFALETLDYKIEIWGAKEADANAQFKPSPPPPSVKPEAVASSTAIASPSPSPSPKLALGTLEEGAWQKIGMGCSCSFTVGIPRKEKLIAGGDGLAFFRLNGEDHLCPAPDTQAMFDGPVSMSCGSAAVQVTPYGQIQPGEDGHSSSARLNIADTSGTLSLTGTWGCGC